MAEPTYAQVSAILKYDQKSGKLFWRERDVSMFFDRGHTAEHTCAAWNSRFAGKEAMTAISGVGYRLGNMYGKKYIAHRVIWLLATGSWPKHDIDHINGIRTDNRLSNLREVTRAENCRNQRKHKRNTSGACGVSFDPSRRKWYARIRAKGRNVYLGRFDDFDTALSVRKAAEKKYGFHPNHGRQ